MVQTRNNGVCIGAGGADVVRAERLLFDRDEVMLRIPHRPPMLLLDGIVEIDPARSCASIRRVTEEDRFLEGHFPGRPMLPGVIGLEIMAQTACFLLLLGGERPGMMPVLAKVESCSFESPVLPGETLHTRVVLERDLGTFCRFSAESFVGDRRVGRAKFVTAVSARVVRAKGEADDI